MNELYTMKEMKTLIGVSDTTLKRYELLNLLPRVDRTTGGQRRYSEVHLQGFKAIRVLLKGFPTKEVHEMFRLINRDAQYEAFWIIAQCQEELMQQKRLLIKNRQLVMALPELNKIPKNMRIGELAELAKVETSAIRYWEERGLIVSERNNENGYRYYSHINILKTMIIPILRKTVYKIDEIDNILAGLDSKDLRKLRAHYDEVEYWNNERLRMQIEGIKEFKIYCDMRMTESRF